MNRLDYAQLFRAMGIAVIPLEHRGKDPEDKLTGGTWKQYFAALPTEYQVKNWLASGWQNFGIVCGWNNLVVIDFDNMDYYNVWRLWGVSQPEIIRYAIEASFKVKTSRGVHVYVSTLEPEANSKRLKKSGGIDIQAQRKYVVGPGSIHPSGHVYEPMDNNFIFPYALDGIETILPFDLFPPIIAEPETGTMPIVPIAPVHTEYGPFEVASGASGSPQGLDLIAKVKQVVRIENLFHDARFTSPDKRWLACRCPFHDDNKPSFWIDTRRQLCGCQVCGMLPMDVINLYARMHNMPESLAVSAMAQEAGMWG